MNDLHPSLLQGVLKIDHEQRASLGDDVDHNLQRVSKLIGTFQVVAGVRSSQKWVKLTIEHDGGGFVIFALNCDSSFDQVFELLCVRTEGVQLDDRVWVHRCD